MMGKMKKIISPSGKQNAAPRVDPRRTFLTRHFSDPGT